MLSQPELPVNNTFRLMMLMLSSMIFCQCLDYIPHKVSMASKKNNCLETKQLFLPGLKLKKYI